MMLLRISWLLALLLLPTLASAQRLQTCASDERHWLVVPLKRETGQPPAWILRERGLRIVDGAAWTSLPGLSQPPAALAHYQSQLVVLQPNGVWLLLASDKLLAGPPLPGNRRAVAATSDNDSLWMLAESGGAQTQPATPRRLYRYDRTGWHADGELPDELQGGTIRQIVRVGDGVTLLRESDGRVQCWESDARNLWRLRGGLSLAAGERVKLLSDGTNLFAWTSGRLLRRMTRDGWSAPVELKIESIDAQDQIDASIVSGEVRQVWIHDGIAMQRIYDLNGKPLLDAARLQLDSPAQEAGLVQFLPLVVIAVALAVFINSIGKAREIPLTREAAVQPAPLLRRSIAAAIDAWPILLALWYIDRFYGEALVDLSRSDSLEAQAAARRYVMLGLAIYWIALTLCECVVRRSLGKLICGLRIVDLDGQPPTRSALFVRNLLRIADIPLAITVLFTPLRQRVGDMAAKTLVTRQLPTAIPPRRENE